MMTTVAPLLAVAREIPLTVSDTAKLLLVFGFGVVLPLLAIALVIMFPLRGNTNGSREHQTVGLGDSSLHDEFWEFIDDVERGKVTISDLKPAPAGGRTHEHPEQPPDAAPT